MKLSMLIAFLIGTTAWAQINNPSIIPVSSAPTGACSGVLPAQIVISTGTIYTCQSGTWGAIGSGGGGGDTITSPNSSLTVGGTSTATTLDINLGHANTFTANQTAAKWIAGTGFDITGAATTGHYLRNNGTDYVDSAIQASDVPTLNQSTTGSAGSITTLSGLPSQSNDTVVMNATGSSASPTAVSMPTCTTGADLYNTTTHAWSCVSTSSGGGFPFTIVQQSATTLASCTSCSWTFPHALQSSGATAMVILGVDGSTAGSFVPPAGWTCTINIANPSPGSTTFPRLVVCIIASAGQTSVSFSSGSVFPSIRLYEFLGTRSFDVTSTAFAATSTVVDYPAIIPTSGAAVFAAGTGVDPSGNQIFAQNPLGSPLWNSIEWTTGSANNRALIGGVYTTASNGTSILPPESLITFNPLDGSGIAYATWSIK